MVSIMDTMLPIHRNLKTYIVHVPIRTIRRKDPPDISLFQLIEKAELKPLSCKIFGTEFIEKVSNGNYRKVVEVTEAIQDGVVLFNRDLRKDCIAFFKTERQVTEKEVLLMIETALRKLVGRSTDNRFLSQVFPEKWIKHPFKLHGTQLSGNFVLPPVDMHEYSNRNVSMLSYLFHRTIPVHLSESAVYCAHNFFCIIVAELIKVTMKVITNPDTGRIDIVLFDPNSVYMTCNDENRMEEERKKEEEQIERTRREDQMKQMATRKHQAFAIKIKPVMFRPGQPTETVNDNRVVEQESMSPYGEDEYDEEPSDEEQADEESSHEEPYDEEPSPPSDHNHNQAIVQKETEKMDVLETNYGEEEGEDDYDEEEQSCSKGIHDKTYDDQDNENGESEWDKIMKKSPQQFILITIETNQMIQKLIERRKHRLEQRKRDCETSRTIKGLHPVSWDLPDTGNDPRNREDYYPRQIQKETRGNKIIDTNYDQPVVTDNEHRNIYPSDPRIRGEPLQKKPEEEKRTVAMHAANEPRNREDNYPVRTQEERGGHKMIDTNCDHQVQTDDDDRNIYLSDPRIRGEPLQAQKKPEEEKRVDTNCDQQLIADNANQSNYPRDPRNRDNCYPVATNENKETDKGTDLFRQAMSFHKSKRLSEDQPDGQPPNKRRNESLYVVDPAVIMKLYSGALPTQTKDVSPGYSPIQSLSVHPPESLECESPPSSASIQPSPVIQSPYMQHAKPPIVKSPHSFIYKIIRKQRPFDFYAEDVEYEAMCRKRQEENFEETLWYKIGNLAVEDTMKVWFGDALYKRIGEANGLLCEFRKIFSQIKMNRLLLSTEKISNRLSALSRGQVTIHEYHEFLWRIIRDVMNISNVLISSNERIFKSFIPQSFIEQRFDFVFELTDMIPVHPAYLRRAVSDSHNALSFVKDGIFGLFTGDGHLSFEHRAHIRAQSFQMTRRLYVELTRIIFTAHVEQDGDAAVNLCFMNNYCMDLKDKVDSHDKDDVDRMEKTMIKREKSGYQLHEYNRDLESFVADNQLDPLNEDSLIEMERIFCQ